MEGLYVKKSPGVLPELAGVPVEYKVLVFGKLDNPLFPGYFAFLAPQDANLAINEKIKGVRLFYTEPREGKLSMEEVQSPVSARREKNGGYYFCYEKIPFTFCPPNQKSSEPTGLCGSRSAMLEIYFLRI